LGLPHNGELIVRAQTEAPVTDVDAELHVQVSFQLQVIRCRPGWPVLGLAAHRWRARGARGGHRLCEIAAVTAPTRSTSCGSRSTGRSPSTARCAAVACAAPAGS